jgi:hypothetical protein
MRRITRLRVPAALAVATLGTTATIALATSCGGDDAPKDAMGCAVFCAANFIDGGAPEPDGGCPTCATENNDTYTCPTGCTPLG